MKRLTFLLTILFVLVSLLIATPGSARATSSFPNVPSGYAYATYTTVPSGSGYATYGPSIPVGLSCTAPSTTGTLTNSGNITSVNSLVNSGTATSTITVNRTATALSVTSTADVKNLKLLGGLISANDLKATVTSTSNASGTTSMNNSQFSGLSITGIPVPANPTPNTKLSIPLVGTVTLNEQSGPFNATNSTSISVIAMDVRITQTNSLGFPVGSHIIVAYAQSGIQLSAVAATAYGLYALGLGGSVPSVGPTAAVGISCKGGSATNTVNTLNSPVIGSTANESSSASGQIIGSTSHATSQNHISNLNLLTGFASADSITTTATADFNGTTGSSSGSAVFQNGKLNGQSVPNNPAPNTRVNLPGIGYAIENEQFGSSSSSGASKTVFALDIYVTTAGNSLNLPAGARIIVSVATAAVASS